MKRLTTVLCLLASAALLTACAPVSTPIVETTPVPRVDTVLPGVDSSEGRTGYSLATLYYRYQSEPFLASETRTVFQQPGQAYELALITELLAGPGTRYAELTDPFPAGLRVISTVRQGRTLFVTLSAEILNGYADEPASWRTSPAWADEVPLRRRLCLQAIVATVTENCDVDQVQFLVEQTGVTGSLRLKQSYFPDQAGSSDLTGPMTRDVSLLLTADAALDTILTAWEHQDWQRLYLYLAARDPLTGTERPVFRDFVTHMVLLPQLMFADHTSGTVNAAADAATYAVNAQLLPEDGQVQTVHDRILHLCRENGLWKISLSQLTGWLEDTP